MLQRVFARQAGAIIQRGWNGIVPLSSGLDSRVVAGMLRHHGAPLKAFTYGPAGNQESQYAKAVADALQIEMRMVSNDNAAGLIPGLLDDMVRRVGMQTRFTAGMGVTIAFTEPQPGTVFLPGHPGNLPTGDVIPRGIHLLRNHQQAIQQIINNYALPVREEVIARVLPGWTPESRMEILSTEWTFDPSDPVGSVDEWALNYHFRRLLLSEMTTYSFYGHWMLPFCDYELVDFFNSVPEEYWAHRRLHIDALIHEVFVDDLAALATLPIAGKRGVPHLPKTTWQDQVVNLIPKSVVGDMVLRRATQSKERDIHNQEGLSVDRPFGPDPLEYWWQHGPDFRDFVIKQYRDWDGMGGIVDVPELLKVIEQPLTPFYQRFGLAIFLTLRAFQRVVENESGNINTRSWSPTRDIGIEG